MRGDWPSHPAELAHLGDENLDGVDTEVVCWISQGLLKTCASVELVSGLDCCQIVMTPIVLGVINAVYTLDCPHRPVPCARSERTTFVDQSDSSFSVPCSCQTCASSRCH